MINGVITALLVIILWAGHLSYCLIFLEFNLKDPLIYIHLIIQAYLYTGLFITGHDAMHKTISKNNFINDSIGYLTCFLFAFMSYKKLRTNHFKHHKYPASDNDPDYNSKSQNFFVWWFKFMMRYTTVLQILLFMIVFNVLKIFIDERSLIMFWVISPLLATFQLFYFGTFVPHKLPHTEEMKPHNSRTLKKNHLRAMAECYFFGYHREHHESPSTPWWKLHSLK